MNLELFTTALLMSLAAIAFVVVPLTQSREHRSKGSVNLPILGTLAVFGMGILLYGVIGRPDVQSHSPSLSTNRVSMNSTQQQASGEKVGSVASLLAGLEKRLAENPADGKGWLLLAQSYEMLGRLDDASAAYEKATALGTTNEEFAARLAGAAENTAGVAEIRGRVDTDPAVDELIAPDATVYIIAKSGDNPMPLAVLRREASELPFDFVLSDANSMVQGAGLSTVADVTITVKVSSSGDALAGDAGLESSIHHVDPAAGEQIDITIGKTGA